ncbi:MAG: M16 family metallopeptidase [Planctomycetota bacterium]
MVGERRREVLPNGLRVLAVENPALHSFVCSVYVRVGPRFEPPEQIGLSHFLEHMIMQGSKSFPSSNAIMRSVEDLGGVVDAGTYAEYTNVVFGVHRKHWPRVMEIASDVLARPLFDEQEIEQEKLIIRQELSPHRDKEGRNISASELVHCLIFGEDVDEAGTRGSPAIMQRFDRASAEGHYRRFFRPSNMVVCLAGGVDLDEVMKRMGKYFGAMSAGDGPLEMPAPPEGLIGRTRAFYRTTEALPTAEVRLCFNAYPLGDPRFDAARAGAHLLGGGLSSRLFTRVREELGLVYDIESHVQGYSNAGLLELALTVSVDHLVEAFGATLEVVRQTAAEGLTEAELERYKEAARCGMDMLCDRASHLADWYGKQELLLGPDGVISPQQYVTRQESITLARLNEVLREMLTERGAALAVVGPYGDEQRSALRDLFPAEVVPAARPGHRDSRRIP